MLGAEQSKHESVREYFIFIPQCLGSAGHPLHLNTAHFHSLTHSWGLQMSYGVGCWLHLREMHFLSIQDGTSAHPKLFSDSDGYRSQCLRTYQTVFLYEFLFPTPFSEIGPHHSSQDMAAYCETLTRWTLSILTLWNNEKQQTLSTDVHDFTHSVLQAPRFSKALQT